jgi:hypothetical protein
VILDRELSAIYGVETRALNQAVKRNGERFPEDFMFQLTAEEVELSRSQTVILNLAYRDRISHPLGGELEPSAAPSIIPRPAAGESLPMFHLSWSHYCDPSPSSVRPCPGQRASICPPISIRVLPVRRCVLTFPAARPFQGLRAQEFPLAIAEPSPTFSPTLPPTFFSNGS